VEVRIKTGWKAGELQDVSPEAARAMLADGRATDPRDEEVQDQDQAPPALASTAPPADKGRKGKKGK
jgi:hypothetical protein